MPGNVFVIGGGVAGLTAAHELSERGYTVTIYEARTERGGKVRSWLVPLTTQPTKKVPAEHGFRFFPGFYRHVTHTMGRITSSSSTVYEALVGQPETVMAPQRDGVIPDVPLPLSLPPGPAPVAPPNAAAILNLTAADYGHMAAALTLYQVLIVGDETVADQGPLAGPPPPRKLDDRSWWNYCGAGAGSNNYRLFFGKGLTRCFVATRAEDMSARTGAGILLQLLFDIAKPDRFENPPKVRPADRALNAPTSAAWIKPWITQLQNPPTSTVPGTPTPTKVTIKTGTVNTVITAASGTGHRVTSLKVTTTQGQKTIAVGPNDSVVFAVSLDGARALIASDAGLQAEPELARLAQPVGVKNGNMNGVQFYLAPGTLTGPLIRGHYLLVESSWAITALSQDSRWWKAGAAPTGGILSVIISDWLTAAPGPGGKSALTSNDAELTTELWRQLRQAIPELPAAKPPFAIDVGIAWNAALGSRLNTEPMLVNTTDSWGFRPHAGLTGSVVNLVIAGDFVRGITDFASMELANETARRAVNVLLRRDGLAQTVPLCKVYDKLEHLSVGSLLAAAIKQLSKTAAFAVAKLLGLSPSETDPNESWWPYEFRSGADINDTADIIFAITDWMARVLNVDTSKVTQPLAARSGTAPDGPTAEALQFIASLQEVHRETFSSMEMVYGPAPRKG
jgi:NAD(P)-binding Rossmann-like domain